MNGVQLSSDYRGDSLLFNSKSPGDPGTHFCISFTGMQGHGFLAKVWL